MDRLIKLYNVLAFNILPLKYFTTVTVTVEYPRMKWNIKTLKADVS
jgi:hypothetical protein